MVIVVVIDAGVFEVEHTDDFAFVDQRDGEFGANFGVGLDVAGVLADVGSEDGLAQLGGGADEAFADRDNALADDALAEARAEAVFEVLGAVVPEEDAEHLEVDDSLEEVCDPLEEVGRVEDAGDLARDVVENAEGLGLAGDPGVEAGVFNRNGHARGDEFEQTLMLVREVAHLLRLDIEDADDLVLDDQGYGKLGADIRVGIDVVLVRGDVFHENGFAMQSGLTGDAAADFDAHPFDFGGVPDLKAHAEVFGAVVEQEDGEDLVGDDGADQVGDAVHEGVEVERGVQGVGELVEEVDLEGFHANSGVGGVRMKEDWRGRAVVTLEWVLG